MTGRHIDYCAARALLGREMADEMFGRIVPPGIDTDHPGDQVMLDGIARDVEKCETCGQARWCHDG